MFYKNFVVSLKSKGKFLRDNQDGDVILPYGCEFQIYLKNLESRRAVVSISIDGCDILDNNQIIVEANSFVDLEGFIKQACVTNKFKFIKKIKEVEEFRGSKPEDGIIRVEVRFEKQKSVLQQYILHGSFQSTPHVKWYDFYGNQGNYGDTINTYNVSCSNSTPAYPKGTRSFTASNVACADLGDGITVGGSNSNQSFMSGYIGELEDISNVIILKLFGEINSSNVIEPIYTTSKIQCKICGRKSDSSLKFCGICGASLV